MIVGDSSRFGIEFSLDEESKGAWMLGHVCYWICGQRIGDYELTVTLRDVLFCWFNIAGDAGKRANDDLMSLDKADLVNLLLNTLFGDGPSDPVTESRAIEEQWARHVIEPVVGYGFTGWGICLVEDANLARCVYRRAEMKEYFECQLNPGEFDKVLKMAIQSLEQHYELVAH
jgi:hypothetical protein